MAGAFTPNLPLTGNNQVAPAYPMPSIGSLIPVDTKLPNGENPQSVAVTPFQIAALAAGLAANTVTATGSGSGAATLNTLSGTINTGAQTTAAQGVYLLTLNDSAITAASVVQASVVSGTSTAGSPVIFSVTPGLGAMIIVVQNIDPTAAINGTMLISFAVYRATGAL